jgi:hypothetical protein
MRVKFALFVVFLATTSAWAQSEEILAALAAAAQTAGASVELTPLTHECTVHAGSCNSVRADVINVFGCESDSFYANIHRLTIPGNTRATLRVDSTAFTPFIGLFFAGSTSLLASGEITITYTTGTSSASYDLVILATPQFRTGSYTLTTTCTAVAPPCTAPGIAAQPQSKTISAGTSTTLSVAATGTEPLSYQWFAGTSGNTSAPIGGATGASVAVSAAGSYWVRVSNACGSVSSAAAVVTVTNPQTCPACVPSNTTACVLGGRFAITLNWVVPISGGGSGSGKIIKYTENRPETNPQYGPMNENVFFSMFDSAPNSVEVIVRMFNGVGINNKYWVSVGGLTNAQYTVTITDTKTCVRWDRTNPFGQTGTMSDQNAFPYP